MELREFAETVLFATTLEEKLRCPAQLTDEHPGPALVTPEAPGRPATLQFKVTGTARDNFPGTRQLEKQSERGRLLHFFANHELLATELMALVLLKFPDAPAAFRKGVLQTLKDEQEHTRLYLERMKSCGIEFGELPVSGYFWRCVAPMEHPIDYVAGLCLTFEQANLDFARHFARTFDEIGDGDTAKLLEKIYRDEIGHVAYGLKWFRRWKNPSESDWEAFCHTLKFPLSPQRAKGFALNVEGRRAAGLDPHFIAELNVYSQSKGRTPTVFVFNPFAEGRIAEGKTFNPTKHQAQLARDLENLPQFLCRQDDIVLVERRPTVEFLSEIKRAGFSLPEFVELSSVGARRRAKHQPQHFDEPRRAAAGSATTAALQNLKERKLGGLRPWAWGPDSLELLSPLFASLTDSKRNAEQCFNERIAGLYSKAWSANFLRRLLSEKSAIGHRPSAIPNWLCSEQEVGEAVVSLEAALAAIAAIRARGHHKIIVKEALGLAGSNAMRLFEPEILPTHRRWMEKACARGRELVVEPWLERVADFSAQLEMTTDGLKLCGYTGLLTDAKGQFLGNWAAPKFERRIPPQIVERFREPPDIATRLHDLFAEIFSRLETELRAVGFLGPLGIDAFVYRDAAGAVRLKPIVEINPRYTMGRVTVGLMKHVAPGSHGMFRLLNLAQVRAASCADFFSYAKSLADMSPLQREGDPVARIREGTICLNDPTRAGAVLATFCVSRSAPRP
ncbi:MAG: DUF455 family protein [Verrucomicrobia bacterium]|nr:MAG: DUF455 family protein [Verrucomicrobiota bacterium]